MCLCGGDKLIQTNTYDEEEAQKAHGEGMASELALLVALESALAQARALHVALALGSRVAQGRESRVAKVEAGHEVHVLAGRGAKAEGECHEGLE